jgi:hypothetical protein
LFAPAITLFAVSYLLHPSFLFRYFGYSTMAYALLAAGGVAALPGGKWRNLAATVLIGLAVYQTAIMPRPFRPNFKGAAEHIAREGGAEDPVVVLKGEHAWPFRFVSGFAPGRVFDMESIGELHQRLLDLSTSHDNSWVVTWHWDRIDALEEWMSSQGFGFDSRETGGIPPVILHHVVFRQDPR